MNEPEETRDVLAEIAEAQGPKLEKLAAQEASTDAALIANKNLYRVVAVVDSSEATPARKLGRPITKPPKSYPRLELAAKLDATGVPTHLGGKKLTTGQRQLLQEVLAENESISS